MLAEFVIILEQTSPDPTRGKDPSKRVIKLHKDNDYKVSIGRASALKSSSNLNARPALPDNALFDVRGISKIHGFVYLKKTKIYYEDNKSRHGSKLTQDNTIFAVNPETPTLLFDLSDGMESGDTEYLGEIFMSPNLASTQSLKLDVYIKKLGLTENENHIKERAEPSSQISIESKLPGELDNKVNAKSSSDIPYEHIEKNAEKDPRASCVPGELPENFDDESDGNDESCAPSEYSDNQEMTCKHASFEFTSTPRGSSFSQIGESDEGEFAGLSESDDSDHLCLESEDEHTAFFFDFGVRKGQDLEANSSKTLLTAINAPQDSSSDNVTLTFDVEEKVDLDSLVSNFTNSKELAKRKTEESQVQDQDDSNIELEESPLKLKREVLEMIQEQQKSLLPFENLTCTEGLKRKLEDTDFETELISPLASVLQPPVIVPVNCNLPVNPDFPVVTVETAALDTKLTPNNEPKGEESIDRHPAKKLRSGFSQLKTFAWGVAAGSVMTVAALIATSPNNEQL